MRYTHFRRSDRHELSILQKKGYSLREIAKELGKHPSSVSRELRRNHRKVDHTYIAQKAHHKAYVRRKYSKYQGMKIREHPELEQYAKEKLPLGWAPDKIAGRWKEDHSDSITLSAHAIYKWLYSPYGQAYCTYLYSRQYRRRRKKYRHEAHQIIKNRVSIEERPLIINERKEFGHFEADTMGRSRSSSLQTLDVLRERVSRYLMGKKVARPAYAMNGFKETLAGQSVRSVTFDNGVENVRHEELNVSTYFCHPYSSWEKGSVENGIGIIRRSIPKGADLKDYSDADIQAIFDRINNIPLRCLRYKTPKEVYEANLLSTGCCT